MVKLREPIEIDVYEGWSAKVVGVETCLLDAAKELAGGAERVELSSAWCDASFCAPSGQRKRLKLNLMAHALAECSAGCGLRKTLLGILEASMLRHRRRSRPTVEQSNTAASGWPYAWAN
jgi:hypothetical protein